MAQSLLVRRPVTGSPTSRKMAVLPRKGPFPASTRVAPIVDSSAYTDSQETSKNLSFTQLKPYKYKDAKATPPKTSKYILRPIRSRESSQCPSPLSAADADVSKGNMCDTDATRGSERASTGVSPSRIISYPKSADASACASPDPWFKGYSSVRPVLSQEKPTLAGLPMQKRSVAAKLAVDAAHFSTVTQQLIPVPLEQAAVDSAPASTEAIQQSISDCQMHTAPCSDAGSEAGDESECLCSLAAHCSWAQGAQQVRLQEVEDEKPFQIPEVEEDQEAEWGLQNCQNYAAEQEGEQNMSPLSEKANFEEDTSEGMEANSSFVEGSPTAPSSKSRPTEVSDPEAPSTARSTSQFSSAFRFFQNLSVTSSSSSDVRTRLARNSSSSSSQGTAVRRQSVPSKFMDAPASVTLPVSAADTTKQTQSVATAPARETQSTPLGSSSAPSHPASWHTSRASSVVSGYSGSTVVTPRSGQDSESEFVRMLKSSGGKHPGKSQSSSRAERSRSVGPTRRTEALTRHLSATTHPELIPGYRALWKAQEARTPAEVAWPQSDSEGDPLERGFKDMWRTHVLEAGQQMPRMQPQVGEEGGRLRKGLRKLLNKTKEGEGAEVHGLGGATGSKIGFRQMTMVQLMAAGSVPADVAADAGADVDQVYHPLRQVSSEVLGASAAGYRELGAVKQLADVAKPQAEEKGFREMSGMGMGVHLEPAGQGEGEKAMSKAEEKGFREMSGMATRGVVTRLSGEEVAEIKTMSKTVRFVEEDTESLTGQYSWQQVWSESLKRELPLLAGEDEEQQQEYQDLGYKLLAHLHKQKAESSYQYLASAQPITGFGALTAVHEVATAGAFRVHPRSGEEDLGLRLSDLVSLIEEEEPALIAAPQVPASQEELAALGYIDLPPTQMKNLTLEVDPELQELSPVVDPQAPVSMEKLMAIGYKEAPAAQTGRLSAVGEEDDLSEVVHPEPPVSREELEELGYREPAAGMRREAGGSGGAAKALPQGAAEGLETEGKEETRSSGSSSCSTVEGNTGAQVHPAEAGGVPEETAGSRKYERVESATSHSSSTCRGNLFLFPGKSLGEKARRAGHVSALLSRKVMDDMEETLSSKDFNESVKGEAFGGMDFQTLLGLPEGWLPLRERSESVMALSGEGGAVADWNFSDPARERTVTETSLAFGYMRHVVNAVSEQDTESVRSSEGQGIRMLLMPESLQSLRPPSRTREVPGAAWTCMGQAMPQDLTEGMEREGPMSMSLRSSVCQSRRVGGGKVWRDPQQTLLELKARGVVPKGALEGAMESPKTASNCFGPIRAVGAVTRAALSMTSTRGRRVTSADKSKDAFLESLVAHVVTLEDVMSRRSGSEDSDSCSIASTAFEALMLQK